MTSDQLRGAILRALYARWEEVDNILMADVEATDLATRLGVDVRDVNRQAQYLALKNPPLLEDQYISGDRFFHVTTDGIDYVEHPEDYPQLQNVIVMITAGGGVAITGSQVGGVGNFQASVGIGWDPAQVAGLIDQLRGRLATADVEDSIRRELVEDLDALAAQARRPAPNREALRAIFQGLSATAQGAAALHQLWGPVLETLRRMFAG